MVEQSSTRCLVKQSAPTGGGELIVCARRWEANGVGNQESGRERTLNQCSATMNDDCGRWQSTKHDSVSCTWDGKKVWRWMRVNGNTYGSNRGGLESRVGLRSFKMPSLTSSILSFHIQSPFYLDTLLQEIQRPQPQSGQASIKQIYEAAQTLESRGNSITAIWIPADADIELGKKQKPQHSKQLSLDSPRKKKYTQLSLRY